MTTPEITKPESVGEPTQPSVPESQPETQAEIPAVSEQGTTVTHTPGQMAQQAADDASQQQQIPADTSQTITITIPATPQQLEDWAKGTPDNSLTWFAFYWIRVVKKALLHGWGVVTQPPITANA